MTSTRQLAAIMFTDIVGYTLLMGKDEKMAMNLVRKNRDVQKPLVEKHGGTWLKEMGDGAMSSFPTASSALYCALEIQQQLLDDKDLNLRIGVHLGEVLIEDGDVFGDGVNIASRLESITEPGGIYISDSVQKAIRGIKDLQTAYLGEFTLKNVDYPVKTYALRGEGLPVPKGTHGKHLSGTFFAELRRRNVHRAGITYLALAFLVYSTSNWLEFPNWINPWLLPGLIIGFLVALYLAWNYERSPQGFVKVTSKRAWESPFSDVQRKPLTGNAVIIFLLVAIAAINILPATGLLSSESEKIVNPTSSLSIAVMPFRNDSEDPNNLYFCNGLMEDVINQLSQIEEIRVPSVTSMLYYRENPKPINEIVEELQVTHLLEGSVRKLDDRVLMSITLIDAKKNEQIWSNRYEMDLSVKGVWEIQFEVASDIVNSLQLALGSTSTGEEAPTDNYQAYDSYLKGREHLRAWTMDQNRIGINSFQHAIDLDPEFQFAYASLAQAYGQRAELSIGPWVDSAKYFANNALEMDSTSAETMVVMGYSFSLSGNYTEGLKWYDRAFEINPKVQYLYNGWCHFQLGNFKEAVDWANYNIENDPKNSIYYIDMSNVTTALGLFDISNDYAKKALEINQGFMFAFDNLSNNEYYQGNYLKALKFAMSSGSSVPLGMIYYKLDSLDKALDFLGASLAQGEPQNQDSQEQLGYFRALGHKALTLIALGDMDGGKQLLESALPDIKNIGATQLEKLYLMAGYQASFGMHQQAIESFNKSVEHGFYRVFEARHNSLLDALRDNPEFQEIMAELGKKNSLIRKQVLAKGYFD